jgi:hypothetical protein
MQCKPAQGSWSDCHGWQPGKVQGDFQLFCNIEIGNEIGIDVWFLVQKS